jgi:hypothetical protein
VLNGKAIIVNRGSGVACDYDRQPEYSLVLAILALDGLCAHALYIGTDERLGDGQTDLLLRAATPRPTISNGPTRLGYTWVRAGKVGGTYVLAG